MAMITLSTAAHAVGLSPITLRQFCQQRRIRGARLIGRTWYVPAGWSVIPGTRGPKSRAPIAAK